MSTMYEFSMTTQTWEYVIAAAALILFGFFWKWLNRPTGSAGSPHKKDAGREAV